MSVIYLIGLLDDGSARDASMPRSSATSVCVPVGETTLVKCRAFYPSGVPVGLSGLAPTVSLVVTCTINPCAQLPEWRFDGSLASDALGNLIHFAVPAATFRGAKLGRYWFQVTLASGVSRWQLVSPSGWILTPALVRP